MCEVFIGAGFGLLGSLLVAFIFHIWEGKQLKNLFDKLENLVERGNENNRQLARYINIINEGKLAGLNIDGNGNIGGIEHRKELTACVAVGAQSSKSNGITGDSVNYQE